MVAEKDGCFPPEGGGRIDSNEAVEPLVFELSRSGRCGWKSPEPPIRDEDSLAALEAEGLLREELPLPELSEVEVVRHFTRLSTLNFHVDEGFYPLGSCTMKYNPKIDEKLARNTRLAALHPLADERCARAPLRVLGELGEMLKEVCGFDAVTFQPCAGAHGELTSLMMIKACLERRGERRRVVVLPDSAHGTNPASAAMCGFQVREIVSRDGLVDPEKLSEAVDGDTAAVMLTNPNTLGLFEEEILRIAECCHDRGAFLYCDGANMNALVGRARPGDMGFDIMHLNLHKTFASPHGGGGPGAGPVLCTSELAPFLPSPVITKDSEGVWRFDHDRPLSIGRMHSFHGNFLVALRAWCYLLSCGWKGLAEVSGAAVLNANYLRRLVSAVFEVPYGGRCMHEFVASGAALKKETGVKTLDVAKRLLDLGFHAPTIYFPLIVEEALMIEPTETESVETLEAFAAALARIAEEARRDPELVKNAPHSTPVARVDETTAARKPDLTYSPCGCCCG